MVFKILVADEKIWNKDYKKIPSKDLAKIFERIQRLKNYPFPQDIHVQSLLHYPAADYRLRIGNYRVLFNKYDDKKEIRLLRVLHRSKLY